MMRDNKAQTIIHNDLNVIILQRAVAKIFKYN